MGLPPTPGLRDVASRSRQSSATPRRPPRSGTHSNPQPHDRPTFGGVSVTLVRPSAVDAETGDDATADFLRLYEATLARFQPEIVVGRGAGWLREVVSRARSRGAAVVLAIDDLGEATPRP